MKIARLIASTLTAVSMAVGAVTLATPATAATKVVETHAYASGTGRVLTATYNDGRSGAPWVLAIHGGYWSGGSRNNIPLAVDAFYNAGFQVFSIDYPLLPSARWTDQRAAVLASVAWVKAHAAEFGVNPQRNVIYGESAGGGLASVAGTYGAGSSLTGGVITAAGASDPYMAWKLSVTQPGFRKLADWASVGAGCPPIQTSTWCWGNWRAFTPALSAGPDDAPHLMLHSTGDTLVPYGSSTTLGRYLQNNGVEGTVVAVAGAEHNAAKYLWANPALVSQTLAWAKDHTTLLNSARVRTR